MEALSDLSINVADPDDIRRKLPEVERLVKEAQIELGRATASLEAAKARANDAHESFNRWRQLFDSLRAMVPEPAAQDEDDESESGTMIEAFLPEGDLNSVDLVVSIINRFAREMRTREVREAAASQGLADDTVSWALWKASQQGRISRIKRGRYAPLSTEPPQSELAVSSNSITPNETPEPAPETGVQTQ